MPTDEWHKWENVNGLFAVILMDRMSHLCAMGVFRGEFDIFKWCRMLKITPISRSLTCRINGHSMNEWLLRRWIDSASFRQRSKAIQRRKTDEMASPKSILWLIVVCAMIACYKWTASCARSTHNVYLVNSSSHTHTQASFAAWKSLKRNHFLLKLCAVDRVAAHHQHWRQHLYNLCLFCFL